ncbi:hypothetical protein EOD39_12452 [Acipenser ruthenus]|uniref:Uncharacterized protein n=1 Tax=Acipenser ruthenus TaxID=7906 RepID=A0A662YQX1_ACIRT|nr:hypothetical protein EOD39_12452 [Acipenser ruthenus]
MQNQGSGTSIRFHAPEVALPLRFVGNVPAVEVTLALSFVGNVPAVEVALPLSFVGNVPAVEVALPMSFYGIFRAPEVSLTLGFYGSVHAPEVSLPLIEAVLVAFVFGYVGPDGWDIIVFVVLVLGYFGNVPAVVVFGLAVVFKFLAVISAMFLQLLFSVWLWFLNSLLFCFKLWGMTGVVLYWGMIGVVLE